MQLKEKIVHFIEQSSQKLRLSYQSTLQSIQIINVLDNHHSTTINKLISNNSFKLKCFAISTLSLCCKLYQNHTIHMRDYVKLIDPKYMDFSIQHLSKNSLQEEEKESDLSSFEIQQLIKQYELTIMLQLKWKISMPLLYDEVIMIAYAWDKYTSQLIEFPLKFQCQERDVANYSQNHNFLVKNIRICIYNFNHLIRNTNLQNISNKIRKMAMSLFYANIKQLLRVQHKINSYILSPKLSIAYLLSDFFKKHYNTLVEQISSQISLITDVLQSYRLFREKSKQKKQGQVIKKMTHKSNKHSQDKENIMYYVNRLKNKSKGKKQVNTDQKSQKYKSRSRSKKDCDKNIKDKPKLIKSKDSIMLKPYKKKSNSTKSIVTRTFNIITKDKEKQKQPQTTQLKKQKKVIKYSKSKVSKRSQKSQITSKIIPISNLQNDFCSKSTYWLKSTTLAKTDKKSTNSSIRMKMR